MSLFEDSHYLYRDTLFVFFQSQNRPDFAAINELLEKLGSKFKLANPRETSGKFESITLYSPQDYSAMDIVYIEGSEVREQCTEIIKEFRTITLVGDDRQKLQMLEHCDARFDVFHFGEVVDSEDDEDEILDPGGLLLLLERLAELTKGVSYDPQAQSLF